MNTTFKTQGVHHVGLTVLNIEDTRRFFEDVLGYELVGERPDYPAVFVTDGANVITLWQVVDPVKAIPFDRKNVVGLHHLALEVESQTALDTVYERLIQDSNTEVEFPPQPRGDSGARHLMCAIPGGIRLELFAAPA